MQFIDARNLSERGHLFISRNFNPLEQTTNDDTKNVCPCYREGCCVVTQYDESYSCTIGKTLGYRDCAIHSNWAQEVEENYNKSQSLKDTVVMHAENSKPSHDSVQDELDDGKPIEKFIRMSSLAQQQKSRWK